MKYLPRGRVKCLVDSKTCAKSNYHLHQPRAFAPSRLLAAYQAPPPIKRIITKYQYEVSKRVCKAYSLLELDFMPGSAVTDYG